MKSKTKLNNFNNSKSKKSFLYLLVFTSWYLIKIFIFNTPFPWPYIIKNCILRIFGAKIGKKVIIKPRVNIHMPWNLKIDNFSWIGEEVNIVNFEKVEIGSNVCISQQVFICSGSHDFRNHDFIYKHSPIIIRDGVWLQARVFVAPGTFIEDEVVVYPNSLVKGTLKSNSIYSDNNLKNIGQRWK